MKIAIGCDHIVTDIKNNVAKYLEEQGHEVFDVGTYDFERTHYPIYGRKVGLKVVNKEVDLGIVICGTGVGITNSVSKVPGIRAVLTRDIYTAKIAKEKLNANVLGLGGRITGIGAILDIIEEFLAAKYVKTDESEKMIEEISKIENANKDIESEEFFDEFLEKWDQGFYHD